MSLFIEGAHIQLMHYTCSVSTWFTCWHPFTLVIPKKDKKKTLINLKIEISIFRCCAGRLTRHLKVVSGTISLGYTFQSKRQSEPSDIQNPISQSKKNWKNYENLLWLLCFGNIKILLAVASIHSHIVTHPPPTFDTQTEHNEHGNVGQYSTMDSILEGVFWGPPTRLFNITCLM